MEKTRDHASGSRQVVVFGLGEERYATDVTRVQEIIRWTEPRSVSSSLPAVRGVINLRGKIIPVCDLKQRLGLYAEEGEEGKIVIVEAGPVTAGLIVDEVEEVLTVEQEQLEDAPSQNDGYISAVAKVGDRLLVLLDLHRLFQGEGIDTESIAA
jgi:purine-binding chemotaxis protein CheW